jgi:hypothetical protein
LERGATALLDQGRSGIDDAFINRKDEELGYGCQNIASRVNPE